jgi:hypothetical protein
MARQALEEISVSQDDAELEKFVTEEKAKEHGIALIGVGTIGLSFAALYLKHLNSPSQLVIYDTRPDIREYISSTLPKHLSSDLNGTIQHTVVRDMATESVLKAARRPDR